MWNYYGSKSIIVDYYPPPKYGKIIEPFCGSARYSLKYFDRDVLLVDKYDVIIRIWKWLQQCSEKDILGLPSPKKGERISEYNLCEEAALFLGFISGVACFAPRDKVSSFAAEQNGRKNKLKRIAAQLFKIKHWDIRLGSYEDIPNEPGTWFIDPPYEFGGSAYVENKINYQHLSGWCQGREGQQIVCENTKATWLPFKPMVEMRGANGKHTIEAIFTNLPTSYDCRQAELFF